MIVSASRRTDVPAQQMDWFAQCIRDGCVQVRNPFNARQVRRVALDPDDTQMVFWTKDAAPMLQYLPLLRPFPYYVQYTVTPYGQQIEPGLPLLTARLDTLKRLSAELGPDRVVWRLDPFIWSEKMNTAWLADQFAALAASLSGWVNACVVSFVDMYRCMRRRFTAAGLRPGSTAEKAELARQVRAAAAAASLEISACCEPEVDGILPPAHCIDAARLARVAGRPLAASPDRSQRAGCGCAASVDVGTYNTCRHGCLYCYAVRGISGRTNPQQRTSQEEQ